MKRTIQHLAASITDAAGSVGIESERMSDDGGIVAAEAVIHLRDAQRCLQAAAAAGLVGFQRKVGD